MRRTTIWVVVIAALAALGISCSDSPTSPRNSGALAPGGCAVDLGSLRAMPITVFGATPTAATVRDQIDTIYTALSANNIALAQNKAHALVAFIHDNASSAQGTTAQLDTLVNTVLCWVGLPETSFVVPPSDEVQVLKTTDGSAGVEIPANGVTEPTVVTITVVDDHLLTPNDTKLDRYPRSVSVTSSTPIANSTVGVCVTNIPASVFPRLRMGHRTKDGFRIEAPAPVDFLDCEQPAAGAKGAVRRMLGKLGRFLLPSVLYAKQEAFLSGGVGGTAGEYSPFEPVDTELSFSGGVGGTAGEYFRLPGPDAQSATCGGPLEGVIGTAVPVECRPRVLVRTANGTVLENVPVTWSVGPAGGTTAPENSVTRVCGVFDATATVPTNANGKSGACWTLGGAVGAQTLVATVGVGGDAPVGVSFFPATQTFTTNGLPITPTATATGETAAFDGLPHGGSGSCTHGLTPALSYSSGSAPVDVGQYTLTVTCGSGNPSYTTATATADIVIGQGAPAITINCPVSVVYTGSAHTPCTATAVAPGLNITTPVTYTSNVNAGTARANASVAATAGYGAATASRTFEIARAFSSTTILCPASVSYTGTAVAPCSAETFGAELSLINAPAYTNNTAPGLASATFTFDGDDNHFGSSASNSFRILYVQSNCFAAPLTTGLPPVSQGIAQGSPMVALCGLRTASGAVVSNATGDIEVSDLGASGSSTPVSVQVTSNAFVFAAPHAAHGALVSTVGLSRGHFYRVTATWNDGSTSTGHFYITQ